MAEPEAGDLDPPPAKAAPRPASPSAASLRPRHLGHAAYPSRALAPAAGPLASMLAVRYGRARGGRSGSAAGEGRPEASEPERGELTPPAPWARRLPFPRISGRRRAATVDT